MAKGRQRVASEKRSWRFVEKTDTCWLWTGGLDRYGYGKFWHNDRNVQAYKWSYESERGTVPEGVCLDHLCRVRACVNPFHLEVVSNAENLARGARSRRPGSPVAVPVDWDKIRSTHCKHGHAYTEENAMWVPSQNRYACRECAREATRRYVLRNRGKAAA